MSELVYIGSVGETQNPQSVRKKIDKFDFTRKSFAWQKE